MEFREYQTESYTAIQPHTSHKDEVLNWLVGLSEEVGEISSLFKHVYYGGETLDSMEVAKEVGDVLWYLSALCTALGLELDTCAALNVAKLQHRFSTKEFDTNASAQRHEKEEAFSNTATFKELERRLFLKLNKEEE